jgi:hypothetical protein
VPKLITVHHPEQVAQQALAYVKTYILLPSGFMGLVCLVGGVGGLAYQLVASDNYTWDTFYQSSGLILLGVLIGLSQTRYQQYLFRQFPEVFAARMKLAEARQRGKAKKEMLPGDIEHPGRSFIPFAYLIGITLLLGSAVLAFTIGRVHMVPALLMPWMGFYWARVFFWRSAIK